MRPTIALKLALSLALPLALALTSTIACSGDKEDKAEATTAAPAVTATAATPASDGPRTMEAQEGGDRPETNNLAPTSVEVPKDGSQPIAVVLVDGKAVILAEERRGGMRVDPAKTYWTGTQLVMVHNEGLKVFGPGDSTWWQPTAVPEGAKSLAELLAAEAKLSTWVEVETLKSGQRRVWVNVGGKRSRAGIFKTDPTSSVSLLAPPTTKTGKESLRLSKASGFVFDDGGQPTNVPPTTAQAVPVKAPDAATTAKWTADLTKLRGAAVTLTWATQIDLDRDGVDEGVVCTKGGQDDQHCYVVETSAAVTQYHGLSSMRFSGGSSAEAPQTFALRGGHYVMHATGSGDAAALWVARYNGGEYLVESVR